MTSGDNNRVLSTAPPTARVGVLTRGSPTGHPPTAPPQQRPTHVITTDNAERDLVESFYATVRQRWPEGRLDYHWHVLPDPAQTALFEPYRDLTHRDGLVPVQPDWYHVTVLHSVPTDEVTTGQLEQIVAQMRRRCTQIAGFDLVLDRPAAGGVSVECAGRPGTAARALWQAAAASTAAVLGDTVPVLPAVYYPHLSIDWCTPWNTSITGR